MDTHFDLFAGHSLLNADVHYRCSSVLFKFYFFSSLTATTSYPTDLARSGLLVAFLSHIPIRN